MLLYFELFVGDDSMFIDYLSPNIYIVENFDISLTKFKDAFDFKNYFVIKLLIHGNSLLYHFILEFAY